MVTFFSRRAALAGLSIALASLLLPSAHAAKAPKRVLVVTHTEGFRHSSIPISIDILKQIAQRTGFFTPEFATNAEEVTRMLTADNLKHYDAVVFDNTTGELPVSDENKAAFMKWLEAGHGFVGMHAATDTFYKWADYGHLIGGYFNGHPWHQFVRLTLQDPKFPGVSAMGKPAEFTGNDNKPIKFGANEITDEIYQFRDWDRKDKHVLLGIDNTSIDTTKGARDDKDYGVAWAKMVGKGRVFYTSLGHREDVWLDPRYQEHITGGLKWALGLTRLKVKPDQMDQSALPKR